MVRTAIWSGPVVMAAAAAPAFAASPNTISGEQQVVRTSTGLVSTGTVTNDTASTQTVTLTLTWLCDSPGTITAGTTQLNGWTIISFVYVTATGSAQRGARLMVSRSLAAAATVPMPQTTLQLSGTAVTGTITAALSAPAPAVVVQPAGLTFPGFTGQPAPQPLRAPARGSDTVTLSR